MPPAAPERDWRASRWKRTQAALIPALACPLIEFLSATYHWRVEGREHLEALDRAGQPFIMCYWHGRIWTNMVAFRDRGILALISENFDGEWIARLCAKFGWGNVRGSSSRGAARALVQLKRELAAGRSVLITPDGPRGPRAVAQSGAVWLAGASGCPLLPVRAEASRFRSLRSWDRHQIPAPGATVRVVIGPPILVPRDADAATLEAKRLELEAALNAPVRV